MQLQTFYHLRHYTHYHLDCQTNQNQNVICILFDYHHLLCSLDYAKAGVDNPNTVFWDTRLEGEYLGEISRGNAPDRVGHIPGAVHLEWNTLVESDSQTIKPANEVQAILEAHGMTPDKEIFTY